ncbi:MAG: dethiobiotin synthase [Phocaeicola sp.]
MEKQIYFVSGIDTDAGKSYCTAWLAAQWISKGARVITQKLIQTGNEGYSEDIDLHRQIMGMEKTEEDLLQLTMPEIYSYPCSPHLAARIDNRPINFQKIEEATQELARRYEVVMIEGAGGVMVPLTEEYLTLDYLIEKGYPLIFVTSGKLGSINHTLLSLEIIKQRGVILDTVLYNLYPPVSDTTIQKDTQSYIQNYLRKNFPETKFITVPVIQ